MPMPQDLVGKVINFSFRPDYPPDRTLLRNGVLADHDFTATLQLYYVIGRVGGSQGRQIKPDGRIWSFSFLKYVAGWVATGPMTTPVLTGPMSGCYLCKYTEGGRQFLAHVGTVNTRDSDQSIAVKTAWKAFVARPEVSNVSGANPAKLYTDAELIPEMPFGATVPPSVMGYFDAAGVGYAMAFMQVESNIKGKMMLGMLRVISVKPMPLLPWATLAQKKTFRD